MRYVGGLKSIRYTLNVAGRVGFGNFIRLITSKNACKTCGLGMGGQIGGMRNEEGRFPEICKKGAQAQLTDIQPAIPPELFEKNTLDDFRKLKPREMERLGRLNNPLHKRKGDDRYRPVTWDGALALIAAGMKEAEPDKTFFYSSGRSSNEAAFVLQLFSRLYGTNNIHNSAFYCHQASGVGMGSTIGVGTATVRLEDLAHADCIFVIGANPASNHPRFMTELMKCRRRGGEVIVINPVKEPGLVNFAVPKDLVSLLGGGSKIASRYLQPNAQGDVALMKGMAKYLLDNRLADLPFIENHTRGFADYKADIESASWDDIERSSGIGRMEIEAVARAYGGAERAIFSWGMGITQHLNGCENVESIVNLALLRGMVGKSNAGLLPLRGHSNVQGIGTVGVTPGLHKKVFENIESHFGVRLPAAPGLDTAACLQNAYEGKMDVAFLLGGNLRACSPHADFTEKALNNIPLKIYLTTTLNSGHFFGAEGDVVILPVATRDEERQPTTQESMFSFVRLSSGGITRLSGVRPETEIIRDIAERVLGEKTVRFVEFKSHKNIRAAIAATIPGLEKLGALDGAGKEFHVGGRRFDTPVFATPDGKAIFRTVPIPPPKTDPDAFWLLTNRSEGQFNSIIYDENDEHRNQPERWIVLMNPADMRLLALNENDGVTLENDTGKMEKLKVRPFDIKPGNLMAYFPEANVLVPNAVDPRSKTPPYKSVAVRLKKE